MLAAALIATNEIMCPLFTIQTRNEIAKKEKNFIPVCGPFTTADKFSGVPIETHTLFGDWNGC